LGGAVDIRTPLYILFQISLRVELRDYYAVNAAKYGLSRREQVQHNIVPARGIVIHV
jgi:heat shock protein HspQ